MRQIILLMFVMLNIAFGARNSIELYEPNSKNFRDGFEAGIKALEFQAKTDGFQQNLININKPYLLVFDIKNTPFHEALFLQIISAREGFDTHFTKEFISLGEFERDIDAKDAKELMIRKYKINAEYIKILKNIKSIVTYPYLFQNFYKTVINDARDKGYIIQTEIIEIEKVIQPKIQPKPKKIVTKKITFKNNRAMGYTLQGNEKFSQSFVEKELLKQSIYEFERNIVTNDGEKFVKVKGQNLFFADSDVEVK